MSLLKLQSVEASYGSSQALFGIDLNVGEGEVVALMGRNGMGKSTTIKVVCRLLEHQNGSLEFDGRDISQLPAHRVARLGIGLVPEGRRCFTNLSVSENLIAAARPGKWTLAKIAELFPRLKERHHQLAGSLSGGEQQMLSIARALMTNPKLLILDEATEGLAPVLRQEIWVAIKELKSETGLSILLVDKTFKELEEISDRLMIVEKGRSVWTGTFQKLSADIKNQYLGL